MYTVGLNCWWHKSLLCVIQSAQGPDFECLRWANECLCIRPCSASLKLPSTLPSGRSWCHNVMSKCKIIVYQKKRPKKAALSFNSSHLLNKFYYTLYLRQFKSNLSQLGNIPLTWQFFSLSQMELGSVLAHQTFCLRLCTAASSACLTAVHLTLSSESAFLSKQI